MPSLGDSAFIILLGLLLFGPKGLAQIARQLGKLMGEFRRASNEFRMQMEEELRVAEQADRQKQIAAIEAAAPAPPALTASAEEEVIDHPHLRAAPADTVLDPVADPVAEAILPPAPTPIPIATSGELSIMPPATGLPSPRTSSPIAPLLDSVPHVDAPHADLSNGHVDAAHDGSEQRPMRYTNGHDHREEHAAPSVHEPVSEVDTATEPVHG